jgi:flagellar motility protein MotE (MotC chaperone)
MLEAMQPESAARVLRDMPDEDVKNLLLNVKRKQAAKILSALDPDRAAKIMR